jgi:phosphoserine phosphatase RsbU/P
VEPPQTSQPSDDPGTAERLDKLQALTDSTLSHLATEPLLIELLGRVRGILDVDTAAVLILNQQANELEARAACGIEEEVRQGVRIPFGVGFAGQIAASRHPVRLDRVDDTTVTNPILWEKGIKVMLGVPLISGDSVVGVLHVGRLETRPFTDDDAALLQVVGDRVVSAIQTRELEVERAATDLLERSLLPARPPACPGLDFAARYVPVEERSVGGDWYDLFTLPSGQLWIVIGDVAGSGLYAAVTMGRIRSALRAYTLLDEPPERVLDRVDHKVSHFEIDAIATVLCATMDPPYDEMALAIAGHPPPVIAVPGRPPSFAETAVSPPIGLDFGAERPRSATTISVGAGTVMAFYTDGLVERRGESLDQGLERLRQAVSAEAPSEVTRNIMRQCIGASVPGDDIALVVMRRSPSIDSAP